jgi:5'-deoxynucleotidase
MAASSFFAFAFRMKYINRWGLMKNSRYENLTEHCAETAMLAHALAVIGNKMYGKSYDENRIALFALYHDVSEIITGDLPTPIKYYSPEMRDNYKKIEEKAESMLVERMSEPFRDIYSDVISGASDGERVIIKAADKICALIKCIEESKSGNREFEKAELSTRLSIEKMSCPEADYFIKEFIPCFYETLDENSL